MAGDSPESHRLPHCKLDLVSEHLADLRVKQAGGEIGEKKKQKTECEKEAL